MCTAQTSTYQQVINDVVKNMKEEYLNEGADIEMLEQLKTVSRSVDIEIGLRQLIKIHPC